MNFWLEKVVVAPGQISAAFSEEPGQKPFKNNQNVII
jgi:hypothetical protein